MVGVIKASNARNNLLILQLFQQADFPDSRTRNALIFSLQSDLLQCNDVICLRIPRLVDNACENGTSEWHQPLGSAITHHRYLGHEAMESERTGPHERI